MMKSPNFDNKFGFGTIFADKMFIFERIEEKGEEKADISVKKQDNTENPGNKGIFFDNKAFGHLLTVGTVTHLSQVRSPSCGFKLLYHLSENAFWLLWRWRRYVDWTRAIIWVGKIWFSVVGVSSAVLLSAWICWLGRWVVTGLLSEVRVVVRLWCIIGVCTWHSNYYSLADSRYSSKFTSKTIFLTHDGKKPPQKILT